MLFINHWEYVAVGVVLVRARARSVVDVGDGMCSAGGCWCQQFGRQRGRERGTKQKVDDVGNNTY